MMCSMHCVFRISLYYYRLVMLQFYRTTIMIKNANFIIFCNLIYLTCSNPEISYHGDVPLNILPYIIVIYLFDVQCHYI